jgi:hypothetical protein
MNFPHQLETMLMFEKVSPLPLHNSRADEKVALAHVKALTVEEASGERFITSAGPVSANDYVVVSHPIITISSSSLTSRLYTRHSQTVTISPREMLPSEKASIRKSTYSRAQRLPRS